MNYRLFLLHILTLDCMSSIVFDQSSKVNLHKFFLLDEFTESLTHLSMDHMNEIMESLVIT